MNDIDIGHLRILAQALGYTLTSNLGSNNPLLLIDSYKASQKRTYPKGTEYIYSYIESRGGQYDKTLWFGYTYIIKKYFMAPITTAQVDEAERFYALHGEPFDRTEWDYVVEKLDGKLPLEIRAIPEGTLIEGKNVLLTVTNTDPNCYGIVSFFETLLMRVWYPTTIATRDWYIKQEILKYFDETSDSTTPEKDVLFKLHDFGARGTSSGESAAIGGMAHLVNFAGTDTVAGIVCAMENYDSGMCGWSIPAGEHSCVTSYGKKGEKEYFKNILELFGKPDALFACPIDSYDTFGFIEHVLGFYIEELKKSGATYVARPDSGDPLTMPVEVIEKMGELYGYTVNSKGYKVLPKYLRAIQGDGITYETLPIIMQNLMLAGWSIDNLAFGMGGGMLQLLGRDDLKFAMKCSAIRIDNKWVDVFKDPNTQPDKKSKKGRFHVIKVRGVYKTFNAINYDIIQPDNELHVCYLNGELIINDNFLVIQNRALAG